MPTAAVTGATSYTGRFIADRLLSAGWSLVNLTRRPRVGDLAPPGMRDVLFPAPDGGLARALEGVEVLYVTHWIRFERGPLTYDWAVDTIRRLLESARSASVRRVVYVSVINASHDAPTAYFRAKARAEDVVRALAPSHTVVRPTVTFGPGDILVNNLAWTLRRFPVFAIPGDGRYPIQPVHVDDIARLAVEAGAGTTDVVVDAGGPETFAFEAFVRVVRGAVGSRSLLVRAPVPLALAGAAVIGSLVRDVVLRRDEIAELEAGLMVSRAPPLGTIRFSAWVREHADELGRRWSNELDRHYR